MNFKKRHGVMVAVGVCILIALCHILYHQVFLPYAISKTSFVTFAQSVTAEEVVHAPYKASYTQYDQTGVPIKIELTEDEIGQLVEILHSVESDICIGDPDVGIEFDHLYFATTGTERAADGYALLAYAGTPYVCVSGVEADTTLQQWLYDIGVNGHMWIHSEALNDLIHQVRARYDQELEVG